MESKEQRTAVDEMSRMWEGYRQKCVSPTEHLLS